MRCGHENPREGCRNGIRYRFIGYDVFRFSRTPVNESNASRCSTSSALFIRNASTAEAAAPRHPCRRICKCKRGDHLIIRLLPSAPLLRGPLRLRNDSISTTDTFYPASATISKIALHAPPLGIIEPCVSAPRSTRGRFRRRTVPAVLAFVLSEISPGFIIFCLLLQGSSMYLCTCIG